MEHSEGQTEIIPPSLPSNLPQDQVKNAEFNTLGFYSEM